MDALILADLGAFALAGKYAPRCERHISTQQSVANHVCAQAWYDLGASRVVLARELGLDGDRGPSGSRVSPELEIEVFCHGASVRQLFRAVPAVQLHDRAGLQPGRLRPALPLPVYADGGKAPGGVFPRV